MGPKGPRGRSTFAIEIVPFFEVNLMQKLMLFHLGKVILHKDAITFVVDLRLFGGRRCRVTVRFRLLDLFWNNIKMGANVETVDDCVRLILPLNHR